MSEVLERPAPKLKNAVLNVDLFNAVSCRIHYSVMVWVVSISGDLKTNVVLLRENLNVFSIPILRGSFY